MNNTTAPAGGVEIPEEAIERAEKVIADAELWRDLKIDPEQRGPIIEALLAAAAPLIVAAELDRIAADFDGVALEFDRQASDPERDRKLHLTGKAIGFERGARDLRQRASALRGDA